MYVCVLMVRASVDAVLLVDVDPRAGVDTVLLVDVDPRDVLPGIFLEIVGSSGVLSQRSPLNRFLMFSSSQSLLGVTSCV